MSGIAFDAAEVRAGGVIGSASYAYEPCGDGWEVRRNGDRLVALPNGYRPLRVSHAGICATDLARAALPFPLPQVTGHEVVGLEPGGAPVLVEINASHVARRTRGGDWCHLCRVGLDTHCTDRLVLGIDRLPGGFAPWILAPEGAIVPVPDGLDPQTAVLAEPFAAAWHAVEDVAPRPGDRIAVLGTGRLGLLVVVALVAWRRRTGRAFDVVGVGRGARRAQLAAALGADEFIDVASAAGSATADVVIDTTGAPDGLDVAAALARREVHLKSTCGQPSAGLANPTALVVDEIAVRPCAADAVPQGAASAIVIGSAAGTCAGILQDAGLSVVAIDDVPPVPVDPAGAADIVVTDTVEHIDRIVRPWPGYERGLVRPRGSIMLAPSAATARPLGQRIAAGGLSLTTSRCGRLGDAIRILAELDEAGDGSLGSRLVTSALPAAALADGYARAAGGEDLKVVMCHPDGLIAPA